MTTRDFAEGDFYWRDFDSPHPATSGVGRGLTVKVFPTQGRAPFFAALRQPPTFGSQAFGGYGPATIIQRRRNGDTQAHLLYGDVEIWGRQGPCWRGVIKETERDGTLHCVGYHEALSWHQEGEQGPSATLDEFIRTGAGSIYNNLPAWMSNDLSFFQANPLVLDTAITLPASDIATQLRAVTSYSDWEYGWYCERLGGVWKCVMHYAPASTTPNYIVTLSAEDRETFMGDSLEGMASSVVTEWGDPATRTATDDGDPTHYLVATGRGKTITLSSPGTQSAADAALIATAAIVKKAKTKAGKTQAAALAARRVAATSAYSFARQNAGVESRARMSLSLGYGESGRASTSRIQLASGIEAYYPSIRPGSIARVVGLPTGPVDLRIEAVECTGDNSCSLDLGPDSGRLDALLARVS